MKNEFVLAFNEVLEDKQLPKEVVVEAIQAAMVSAYRRAVNASSAQHIEATIDLESGKVAIYAEKEVVDHVQDSRTEVSLSDALSVDPEVELGGMVVVETTPKNFGRVAAQTARQVIQQRIREAERAAQLEYYSQQLGEIISGIVQAFNPQGVTLGLDKRAEGIMPRNQQIPGERFRVHDRVRALLFEIKQTNRGPQIILSRSHRKFLRRLLENEVPEIYQGLVEIRSIAREPGHRSKVAVSALQPGVDPVGACVGLRGVRIQAIVRELSDEKIDVIEWNPDPAAYIAKALSPARVSGVFLNEHAKGTKTATVVVPEDQLSLAIGRDGQNARLAAKLTSWRIDIKSLPEAATDALHKLQVDPEYAQVAGAEQENIPQVEQVLAKKADGRPVTPEEYQVLTQFVNRVERGILQQREDIRRASQDQLREARERIPEAAFSIPIEELGISPRFTTILGGAGYTSLGDLMLQIDLDEDAILVLDGIGPKAIDAIHQAIDSYELVTEEDAEIEAPETMVEAIAEGPELEQTPAETELEGEPVEAEAETGAEEAPIQVEAVEQQVEGEKIAEEVDGEEFTSLEEIFALRPEVLDMVEPMDVEEEDEDEQKPAPKKKKKKKKYVEVEYDPDEDVVVVRKKRKRSGEDSWSEDWDL